jgi:hypothetical protein
MRFFGSRSLARSAPLAAAAVLLCVGVVLLWLGDGSEAPGSPTKPHYSQVDQGANGDRHMPSGSYLATTGEETNDDDKRPVNADVLTALLLACFFGAIVGWRLTHDRGQASFCLSGIARRPSFVGAHEAAPFLGVFRL